jgi:hypothetical protein
MIVALYNELVGERAHQMNDRQALLKLYEWWPKTRADLQAAGLPPIHEVDKDVLLILARKLMAWGPDART